MTARTMSRDEVKLSASSNGYWRNKYWSQDGWNDCDPEAITVDVNTCILSDRYASEEEAELAGYNAQQSALLPGDRWYDPNSIILYLGAEFFDAEQSA